MGTSNVAARRHILGKLTAKPPYELLGAASPPCVSPLYFDIYVMCEPVHVLLGITGFLDKV